jgi:alpha-glucosidase
MNSVTRIVCIATLMLATACAQSGTVSNTVVSPSGINAITFRLVDGLPSYSVAHRGVVVIDTSKLGFVLKDVPDLSGPFRLVGTSQTSFDETWTQVWGEKKDIRNNYNELRVTLREVSDLGREMMIVFRAFDDGVGFRYEIPQQPSLDDFVIMDELTEFRLTGNHRTWSIDAYQWNRYEFLYEDRPLAALDTVHTPITLVTSDSIYVSFHEAALVDFSSMSLEYMGNHTLKANLFPWGDGDRVKASTPMVSPWRTIQIADKPGDLITSYLILNLNEPNKLDDTSWIKPGKYVGIWWEMHLDKATWGSGPKHGATSANTRRYIDFAATYGFDGVLVEGWNLGWDGDWIANRDKFDFLTPYPDFDLVGLAEYARSKGTRLIGHHETATGISNYERQMTDAFALYQGLGVRAVKTGYVGHRQEIEYVDANGNTWLEWHHGQYMVRHHDLAVRQAAKHQIMLNVHEPIKDTGLRRTWPNLMTREGARGQEYNAWGGDGGNPPNHVLLLPFTRMLSGPMDYTPGVLQLTYPEYRSENRINHTMAKELALYVVLYSPLQMAADLPENYEKHREPFQFIIDVPADWEDTHVLNAKIGEYLTMVRKDRNSEDWFLGSITDTSERSFSVLLDFLDPSKRWLAHIYRDADDSHWQNNAFAHVIEKVEVTPGQAFAIRLAPGGGMAVRFHPITD